MPRILITERTTKYHQIVVNGPQLDFTFEINSDDITVHNLWCIPDADFYKQCAAQSQERLIVYYDNKPVFEVPTYVLMAAFASMGNVNGKPVCTEWLPIQTRQNILFRFQRVRPTDHPLILETLLSYTRGVP